jgi:hypothetical protein
VLAFAVLAALMGLKVHAATCESLRALSLPHTNVTLAQPVAAGAFSPPAQPQRRVQPAAAFEELPAFCRVAATLTPSSSSEIRIEVWMPVTWTARETRRLRISRRARDDSRREGDRRRILRRVRSSRTGTDAHSTAARA